MNKTQGKVRNGKKILLICLVFLSLITLSSAELGFADNSKPNLKSSVDTTITFDINESILNVNYSENSGLLDGTDWNDHINGEATQLCYFNGTGSVKGIPDSEYNEISGEINLNTSTVDIAFLKTIAVANLEGTKALLGYLAGVGVIVGDYPFGSAYTILGDDGNLFVNQNVTADYFKGNGSTLTDICLSNGTNCLVTSGMNYTNVALTNQTNNFTKTQYFGNKTIIQNPQYLNNPVDSVYVYYEIGDFTTPLLVRNEEGIANILSNTPVAYMEGYWPSFVIRDVDSSGNGLATGFSAEAGGQLLSFGTNYPQLGYNNPNYPGAYFRIDTRAGYESQLFQVATVATEYGGEGTVMTLSQSGELFLNNISTIGTSKIPSIWNTTILNNLQTGNITYSDTYYEDIVSPLSVAQVGITAPTFNENQMARGFADGVNEQYAFVAIQIPHAYKQGTNIVCHLHVRPDGTQKNNVTFEMNYSWTNLGIATGATTTITKSQNFTSGVALNNTIIDFGSITGTGKTISSSVLAKITRKSNAASDTYTGSVFVDFFDCHYEQDSPGSRSEYVK